MRYGTVITLFKKHRKGTDNTIVYGVRVADSEEDAIVKAIADESVATHINNDFKIFWKVAFEIPELNTETGKYELLSEANETPSL